MKTVGLVINEGEPNAVIMAKNAEETLTKHGIKLIKAPVTNTSEVKQAAQSLVGRADAFLITLDNTVVSGVDGIIQIANEKKFLSSLVTAIPWKKVLLQQLASNTMIMATKLAKWLSIFSRMVKNQQT